MKISRRMLVGAAATGAVLAASAAQAKGKHRLKTAQLAAWMDAYKSAWEKRDAKAAGQIFTEDATYRENPFEPAFEGRAGIEKYWSTVTAGQSDIVFTYEIVAINGDEGICHWHADLKAAPNGDGISLDGMFRLRFANATQVSKLEEWWLLKVTPAAAPTPTPAPAATQ